MVKFFKTPFASNGDKLNIPEELQEDGSISFDQGYGEDYEKNRKTDPDAKNISRQSFNGLLHDITDAIGDIQRSGVAKWSDEVTYNKGSLVWHDKSLYSSLLDSNKSQPPSASWTALLTKESLDLTAYRKKDDNIFNGYLQVRSENEDQGTGISLQDTEGTVRGQVVATEQGLQLTQYPKDGGSQTFTFPSVGGELALGGDLGYVTPYMFGGKGDGITNDTQAIQRAIDTGLNVLIPHAQNGWLLEPAFKDNVTGWNHCLVASNDTQIIMGSGTLKNSSVFSDKTVMLTISASNVMVLGVGFEGTTTGQNSWSIGIGIGNEYYNDVVDNINNITVDGCRFNKCWIGSTVQYKTGVDVHKKFKGFTLNNCVSHAKKDSITAGNFNWRTENIGQIQSVHISNCYAYDGKTASSYNAVGIKGVILSNVYSEDNWYAGIEIENGCEDVFLTNIHSKNDYYGVWLDDSRNILLDNLIFESTVPINNSPFHPPAPVNRPAINITRQGWVTNQSQVTENIRVSNVIALNGGIRIASFGEAVSPTSKFGDISFKGITFRGIERNAIHVGNQTGNTITLDDLSSEGGKLGSSFSLNDSVLKFTNSDLDLNLAVSNTGKLDLHNVKVRSTTFYHNTSQDNYFGFVVGGEQVPNIDYNRVSTILGVDSPDGVVARQGSILTTKDGKLYIKSNNVGDSGWIEKGV